jgi:P4 family phage/plasmid primase-like protien
VLLNLTKKLLGPENVVAVPLQQLSENRFAIADLYLKLANICGDLDARAVKRSDMFKMLTGSDAVPAERKYGHPFFFTPFALPIFSANEVPISADQSDAWFQRWLVIPMERRFRGTAHDDPHILDKLTTPAELEGLLVEAVAGLRRLMARGRFDVPTSVRQAGERYRTRLDTLCAFVEEECELDADAWVSRPALYRAYKAWCEEGGRFALSAANFNERLVTNYSGRVELRTREGGRGWLGLRYVGEEGAAW